MLPPTRGVKSRLAGVAIGAIVAIALLAGCSSSGSGGLSSAPAPSSLVQAEPTPESSVPARTEPVPAPDEGTTDDVIPPALSPGDVEVSLDGVAELPGGIEVEASKLNAINSVAQTPGDLSGPAIAATITIRNNSKVSLHIDNVMVTLVDSDGQSGIPSASDPYEPFSGTIAPGASAEGLYVFVVPEGARGHVQLSVAYSAGVPVALLIGDASH